LSHTRNTTGTNPPWVEFLEGSLAQVETVLQSETESQVRAITNIVNHSLHAGGKRFRPALVILGALASDPDADVTRAVRLGAGMELIHLAALMHDDVVDGSDSRRGQPSANAFYGNKVSILVGDYVLARALSIMSQDSDSRISACMAEVSVALAEGEVLELVMRGSLGELESLYWKMIARKTARLISASVEIGGISVEASKKTCDALASYGERMGLVFQLTDDLLDLVGTTDSMGKPVGADLRDGKVTLPYILTLREETSELREELLAKTFDRRLSERDIRYLTERAQQTGALDACYEMAREQVEIALGHLAHLPVTPARAVLEDIGPYLLGRTA